MKKNKRVNTLSRKPSDNEYLHKDFHQSMNLLLDYIYISFGKKQLIRYLDQYAKAYYKNLRQELQKGDITPLLAYFENMYAKEKWSVKTRSDNDYIYIEQNACPGITHIKSMGGTPCAHYKETYNTVYKALCHDTPFEYKLLYFDEETGTCEQVFKRKEI